VVAAAEVGDRLKKLFPHPESPRNTNRWTIEGGVK
jgi:hypothetical protein